jgi:hypothetical protein
MRRTILVLLFVAGLVGCASLARLALDDRYGPANPARFDHPLPVVAGGVSYRDDVQPILERRCVVCHGCYDAPCQLKLSSFDGVARGATKEQVYAPLRLSEAPPTRLGIDAQQPSQWRRKDFFSVLNERTPSAENNLAGSILARSLQLKRVHPLPADAVLLPKSFDVSLDRSQTCPRLEEMEAYEKDHPLAGMPYGLPGLSEREDGVITRWLAAGSPVDAPQPLPASVARQVREWEQFFNGNSRKEQLMSRYLYEHLFLGHLIFEGDAQGTAFKLIRSAAAPGQPAVSLATRRPFDNPGVARVYYRLVPDLETRLAKTHMPYLLSAARMAKYQAWFLDTVYSVETLPSYDIKEASNPFITFAAIPANIRYRFLLDESEFFIANFIKGPVCRGQGALSVINERFWVFFYDPDTSADEAMAEMLHRQADNLRLPAAYGSDASLLSWRKLAKREEALLAAKAEFNNQYYNTGTHKMDLTRIWDGERRNPNAALTVMRQFDSASVVKGLVGEPPKTAWVIGYPLFERIFYLLAAGYDPYGNVAHQLDSRLYMDFMRMEGEANFLMLLPQASRESTRDYWYRGASDETKSYVNGSKGRFEVESSITYRSADVQRELYGMLREQLAPVLSRRFDLASLPNTALRTHLQGLSRLRGAALSWLPESVSLQVTDAPRATRYFTVLRNTGHRNVASLLREGAALLPEENGLTVVPGFIGAYPNALVRTTIAELPAMTAAISTFASEADYRAFADRFVIRRTSPEFWPASDALMDAYVQWSPLEAGLLDYNRLENR